MLFASESLIYFVSMDMMIAKFARGCMHLPARPNFWVEVDERNQNSLMSCRTENMRISWYKLTA